MFSEEKNLVSFFDFFETINNNNGTLYIPPVQRPVVWSDEKLLEIFKSKQKNYFGSITLISNQESPKLVDGQQRSTTFALLYKKIKEIKTESLIMNASLGPEEKDIMNEFFGDGMTSEEIFDSKTPDIISEKWKTLELLGYGTRFSIISKLSKKECERILKTNFVSINEISGNDLTITEHDIFIDLNSSGTPLSQSDIIKAIMLKAFKTKKPPITINEIWQKSLFNASKLDKYNFDTLLSMYLFAMGNEQSKKEMISHYRELVKVKEISPKILETSSKHSKRILEEVQSISSFVASIVNPQLHDESKDKFDTFHEDVIKSMVRFGIVSGVYKPMYRCFFEKIENGKTPQSIKNSFLDIMFIIYLTEANKLEGIRNKAKKTNAFVRPAEIRQNAQKYLSDGVKFNIDVFMRKIFKTLKVTKKPALDIVVKKIIRGFRSEKYGKTLRIVCDWIIYNEKNKAKVPLQNYKAMFTADHFYENASNDKKEIISTKKLDSEFIFLLEDKLHDLINGEQKMYKGIAIKKKKYLFESKKIKLKYYGKSKHPLTKSMTSFTSTSVRHSWESYYTAKLSQVLKSRIVKWNKK